MQSVQEKINLRKFRLQLYEAFTKRTFNDITTKNLLHTSYLWSLLKYRSVFKCLEVLANRILQKIEYATRSVCLSHACNSLAMLFGENVHVLRIWVCLMAFSTVDLYWKMSFFSDHLSYLYQIWTNLFQNEGIFVQPDVTISRLYQWPPLGVGVRRVTWPRCDIRQMRIALIDSSGHLSDMESRCKRRQQDPRRNKANARERHRMHGLNAALDRLRRCAD